MRVFYARAEKIGDPSVVQSALIKADDIAEALKLVRAAPEFAGYVHPPRKLEQSDLEVVARRLGKPLYGVDVGRLSKGVHAISRDE